MKAYWKLLVKEFGQLRWSLGFMALLIVLWQLYLASKLQNWSAAAIFASSFGPLACLPFWLLWNGIQGFRSEWSQDTAYLQLSLPLAGWCLVTAKLVVVLGGYTACIALFAAGYSLFLTPVIPALMGEVFAEGLPGGSLVRNGVIVFLLTVPAAAGMVILGQFAYIASRVAGRFQGIVLAWLFVLAVWLVFRLGGLLQPLLAWLPPVKLDTWMQSQDTIYWGVISLDISGYLMVGLVTVALVFFSSWILEHHVDL